MIHGRFRSKFSITLSRKRYASIFGIGWRIDSLRPLRSHQEERLENPRWYPSKCVPALRALPDIFINTKKNNTKASFIKKFGEEPAPGTGDRSDPALWPSHVLEN